MADPNDNMDEVMMDLINSGGNQNPQVQGDDNEQIDDGSQYFADYEELMGDNPDEVYLQSSIYVYT
jgi:hypothetical protein